MTRRPLLLLVGAVTLASCAYYNGLYNAEDLARRADHAAREGREFEARSFWAQSAVKAESVLVHHPHSRWTEEARWLRGKALERSGDCRSAIAPLQRTLDEARDARRADDAALRLATCQATLGDFDAAGLAAERLIGSPDSTIRAEATWRTGTTYRRNGRTAEAITLLRRSGHPRARGELAAALADAGQGDAAIALADSLLAERDTLAPWGAIFAAVARQDPVRASDLLDRSVAALTPSVDSTQAWLLADGARWLARDSVRARARLRQTYLAGRQRTAGVEALLLLLHQRLAVAVDAAILDSVASDLAEVPPTAGAATFAAQDLAMHARWVRSGLDSIAPPLPQGDLRGFLLAEAARDTLKAPRLAAAIWRRVIQDRPTSPYAPKALLALAAVGAASTDSVLAILDARYPTSPYLHAFRGEEDRGFRSLEDSLFRYGLRLPGPTRFYRGAGAVPTRRGDSTTANGRVIQ